MRKILATLIEAPYRLTDWVIQSSPLGGEIMPPFTNAVIIPTRKDQP